MDNDSTSTTSNPSLDRLEVLEAYERLKYPDPMRIKKIADKYKWSKSRTLKALQECRRYLKQSQKNMNTNKLDIKINNQPKHIQFLNECIYEYLQRAQHHQGSLITEELIIKIARKFAEFMKMDDFTPYKKWFPLFKVTYNISLSNRKIILTREPPSSLDLEDIISYCRSQQTTQEQNDFESPIACADQPYCIPVEESLNFKTINGLLKLLEIALKEYIKRVQLYYKDIKIEVSDLILVAINLKEILNIKDFEPTKNWLKHFYKRKILLTKSKSSSLNLLDILYHCSYGQIGKKCVKNSITSNGNASKSLLESNKKSILTNINIIQEQPRDVNKTISTQQMNSDSIEEQQLPNIDMLHEEIDIKPNLEEIFIEQEPKDVDITKLANNLQKENRMNETAIKQESNMNITSIDSIDKQLTPNINILQEEIHIKQDVIEAPKDLVISCKDQQNIPFAEDEGEELLYVSSSVEALRIIKSLEVYYGHNDRAIVLFTKLEDAFRNH